MFERTMRPTVEAAPAAGRPRIRYGTAFLGEVRATVISAAATAGCA
jgi:hypothetical protein